MSCLSCKFFFLRLHDSGRGSDHVRVDLGARQPQSLSLHVYRHFGIHSQCIQFHYIARLRIHYSTHYTHIYASTAWTARSLASSTSSTLSNQAFASSNGPTLLWSSSLLQLHPHTGLEHLLLFQQHPWHDHHSGPHELL